MQDSRSGSRVPARIRIVGWLLLTLVIALATVIVSVRSTMIGAGGRDSNASIVREIEELRTFAEVGRDPRSAQPFTGVDAFFSAHLERQRPDPGELLVGVRATDERTAQVIDGPGLSADELQAARVNLVTEGGDVTNLRTMLAGDTSGVIATDAGEVRYGRSEVRVGDEVGNFLVIQFDEPYVDQARQVTELMTLVSVGAVVLSAGLAYVFAGQILRPVRTVRRAAAEITERDLTRRIPVQGNDDIAELAVTFNGMLDRLDNAFSLQQRFVDDVSHELRTPITIIRGHLETMPNDPVERAAATALILDELDRMGRIVADLLVLAKAERPNFIQVQDHVDTAELTLDIDSKMVALGDRQWHLSEVADGTASLDPQRVQQAVLQLAQNAVEHTAPGAVVELGSRFAADPELGAVVVFSVRDEGKGMSADDAQDIFERFRQAGARRVTGAGLGLSIVRAIADGHGGSVYVESRLGVGSTFGLVLPVHDGGPRNGSDATDTSEVLR